MKTRSLTPEERFELIMECRSSGLSDYQWCKEHGLATSTFYTWISRFRKAGYPNIPEPVRRESTHKAQPQEVVKVNILPDPVISGLDSCNRESEQSAPIYDTSEPAIEIIHNGTVFRINNSISPQLLDMLLLRVGGAR